MVQRVRSSVTLWQVAVSTLPVQLFAASTTAELRMVYNDSAADLYLAFGASASPSRFTVKVAAQGFYEFPGDPLYAGLVTGMWSSAVDGYARVTEG